MAKKTTITLDSELRTDLYIMKNSYGLKSIESVIKALFVTKDDVKIKEYVAVVLKQDEEVLRQEIVDVYGYSKEDVDMLNFKELKNAIQALKKQALENPAF